MGETHQNAIFRRKSSILEYTSHADDIVMGLCPNLTNFQGQICFLILTNFLDLMGSKFGYTYFKEICYPISIVYSKI